MWCCRRMEKISWTDHVRNEEVLVRVKKQRNILHEIRKWKVNWICHILRRNCLLRWVIEGKIQGGIEVTGRQGRRCRKLLDDLKERRGYSYLMEETLDPTMWRAHFGRGFGPVVRQTAKWMNDAVVKGHVTKKNMQQTQSTKLKLKLPLCWGQPTVHCPVPVSSNVALYPNLQMPSSDIWWLCSSR